MRTLEVIGEIVVVIGAITGVILCVVGVITLICNFTRNRRLKHEPYFRNVWSEIRPPLDSCIEKINKWIGGFKQPRDQYNLLPLLKNCVLPNFEQYTWGYDKRLYRLLKWYRRRIEQLELEMKKYNKLLYPTTSDFARWLTQERSLYEGFLQEAVEQGKSRKRNSKKYVHKTMKRKKPFWR